MCMVEIKGRGEKYLRVACANGATTKTMSGSSPDDNTLSDRAINELDVCVCVCVCAKGFNVCVAGDWVQGVGCMCRV